MNCAYRGLAICVVARRYVVLCYVCIQPWHGTGGNAAAEDYRDWTLTHDVRA